MRLSSIASRVDYALVGIIFMVLAAILSGSVEAIPTSAQSSDDSVRTIWWQGSPYSLVLRGTSIDSLSKVIQRSNPLIFPRKIQVGQLVWVPDEVGYFRAELANSFMLKESKGCIWWMAREEIIRRYAVSSWVISHQSSSMAGGKGVSVNSDSLFPWKTPEFYLAIFAFMAAGGLYILIKYR